MSAVTDQVHTKFKLFTGVLGADHALGPLAGEVAEWVKQKRVAAKSIGVEYLEAAGRLVLTLGYRDDEEPYEIALSSISVGRIERLDQGELESLERAMTQASTRLDNILCHELYVTGDHEFLMVFMTCVG